MKLRVLAVCGGAVLTLCSASAISADLLGVYAGGTIGRAEVEATTPYYQLFKEKHTAFKVIAGVRPIPWVGAEMAYVDFGHPSTTIVYIPADVSLKGAMAVGNLYLPLPIVDLYAQAGISRLRSSATTTSVCPPGYYCIAATGQAFTVPTTARVDRTNTGFVAGGGAQLKLGAFALRAEYERFNAAGVHPSLVSVGFTWTFL